MKKKVSIDAEVEVTTLNVVVSAAPNSSGDVVAYIRASSNVTLANMSVACGIQYRINQADWVTLGRGDGIELPINLLVDQLKLRRVAYDGGIANASLVIEGATSGSRYVLSGNSRSQLPKMTSKLAKIRLGKITGANGSDGQLRIGLPGDSTITGAGGGTGAGLLVGARAKNVVAALKAQINKRGIRCIDDSIMGDQLTNTMLGNVGYPQFDPRLAFTGTAGIFPNGNMRSLGGVYFRLNALTDSMIFQPSEAWDTARIHTVNASAGAASMSINNGESTAGITGNTRITTTNIGQAAFASQVITKAKGMQALMIGNVAGSANSGTPVIRGIEVWDSTTPAVNLIGLGEYGVRLSLEYTSSAFQAAFLADQYDCIVIDMTINDINAGGLAALPAYLLALDQTVTAAKAAGSDVIICTPNSVNLTKSTVDAYNAAIVNYALANNIYLLDINAEMGEFSAANANGLLADSLHPTDVGYQVKAVPLAQLITSI